MGHRNNERTWLREHTASGSDPDVGGGWLLAGLAAEEQHDSVSVEAGDARGGGQVALDGKGR